MALKTLGELNQDFNTRRGMYASGPHYEHITPRVIDVRLPWQPEKTQKADPAECETPAGSAVSSAFRKASRGNSGSTGLSGTPAGNAEDSVPGEKQSRRKSKGVFAFISNMVFYLAIVLIMVTVMTSGAENGMPRTFFGYSYFTVISKSMQDEIPKGSFILVKHLDAENLKTGDTITYIRDRNTSVTHKIIDIYENYNRSGARGFQTKGVNNVNPDSEIVYESAIVGKVILSVPVLGAAMSWLASNVYLVFVIFGLSVIMSFCIRGLLIKPPGRKVREAG